MQNEYLYFVVSYLSTYLQSKCTLSFFSFLDLLDSKYEYFCVKFMQPQFIKQYGIYSL